MPQPLSDYFALEAGEFLDQLDLLLARPAPDFRELFRLARGVRGSAQIAGSRAIAGVAERLEEAAREVRDGRTAWSDELRGRAVRTVDDLRVLVRAHPRWEADEEERARTVSERWGVTGGGRREAPAAHGGEQIFSFVQREIAQVVTEMDRVVAELRESPTAREPLRAVLRRMRPVRGVAGMPALAPVLEVLEGIEDGVHEMMSRSLSADGFYVELLEAARESLAAAGRHLERGEAPGDSPELFAFRDVRDRGDGGADQADVVPVSTLFVDGPGPHVVASPMAPVPAQPGDVPGEVESFLRIEATGFLDRAEALVAETEGRPGTRFSRVARQLSELAANVRELAATYALDGIAAAAAAASDALRGSLNGDGAREAILDLRSALPGAPPRPSRAERKPAAANPSAASTEKAEAAAGAPSKEADAPSAGAQAADADGVVPVEAILYDPPAALREALGLRPRIKELVGSGAARGTPLGDAIDELFGLVELGMSRNEAS
ncbi:MAG: Hpt domain protein [Gemmatimonadetes bacterium]|nr:Hpt domain protein [Gemmatimonadota bacterium]